MFAAISAVAHVAFLSRRLTSVMTATDIRRRAREGGRKACAECEEELEAQKPNQRGRTKEWCDDKETAKPVTTRPAQAGRARGKRWGRARSGLDAATTTASSLSLSLAGGRKQAHVKKRASR